MGVETEEHLFPKILEKSLKYFAYFFPNFSRWIMIMSVGTSADQVLNYALYTGQ